MGTVTSQYRYDITSMSILHHSKSHAAAVKTMHCQHKLLIMWLDTMAPTLNSFNFSAVLNMTPSNLMWKRKWFKINS